MKENQDFKGFLRLFLSGFAMGSADVVPGVSGGTIAFILGIYQDLLNAIHGISTEFLQLVWQGKFRQALGSTSVRFLVVLGTGLLLAILTISRVLTWGLEQHPQLIWAFFFGLVLASVFVVRRRVRKWTPVAYLLAIGTAVFAFALIGMTPVETPTAPWFLFLSGAIAISAMILPGVSGAFLLLVLGKYQYLLQALVEGNWLPLLIVAAGAAIGLLSFARLLRWLFFHHHDLTVAALVALMIGGLRKVWPWKELPPAGLDSHGEALHLEVNIIPTAFTLEVALALGLMLAGFALVSLLERFGAQDPVASLEEELT